ncbi:MAG: hypothetical protein AABW72_05455 [archaeon]
MSPRLRSTISKALKWRAKKLEFKRNLVSADSNAVASASKEYARKAALARVQIIGDTSYAKALEKRAESKERKAGKLSKKADRLGNAAERNRQWAKKINAGNLKK